MSRNWTPAQMAAMSTRNKTLLVSAAAGSGKTATLTERIIRGITDETSPSDISKLLIVTFTRAAAEELKTRIFGALSEALAKDPTNKRLTSQLIKLGSARISTIDCFYLELIRTNFSELGLSPSFRIADPTELEILGKSVMEDTIEYCYETDEQFPSLVECFTGTRSANGLPDILLGLFRHISSVPEGLSFLKRKSEELFHEAEAGADFFSTEFGKIVKIQAKDMAQHGLSLFEDAIRYAASDEKIANATLASFFYDRDFCASLLAALNASEGAYEKAKAHLESFVPQRMKPLKAEFATEEIDHLKDARSAYHKELKKLAKNSFAKPNEVILRAMKDTAIYTLQLYQTLSEYADRIQSEKERRGVLDFNDIRRYTLKLLVDENGNPTPVARKYAEEFSEIYIDEYQDVDLVQDLIFRALSREDNRFMVGDIKQSIYSFRGAEPQVFSGYRTVFPALDSEEGASSSAATIFMSENFRCDKNVIDFTNLVCSRIFSACVDSIGYQKEDDLVFGKAKPSDDYRSPKVRLSVILTKEDHDQADDKEETDEESPDKKELEAMYIASEIDRLIRCEKKADGTPIRAGDIAVLFRSHSMSAPIAEALRSRGIKTSETGTEYYFENPDVLMVLCLLNTVDNPHRDIFLTGALRSPLFGFTMDELIAIRSSADPSYSLYDALLVRTEKEDILGEKCRRFHETLTDLRQSASALSVDRFLRLLFESELFLASGLVTYQQESGEGGNLLQLYEYARTFEAGSFKGLYNFIEFINTLIEEEKKMQSPPKVSSPDCVNLLSIHQSKGLEFPVCFLAGAANQFNRQDQRRSLLFEYPTGIAMKISDSTGFARINTPMREALATSQGVKQSEEEMRILYVALTRARERLYVTAVRSSTKERLMARAISRARLCDRYTLMHCNSYLDWILIPFADPTADTSSCELTFLAPTMIDPSSDQKMEVDRVVEESPEANEELYLYLKEKYEFCYPHKALRKIPAKLTVSKLSPDVLDDGDIGAELFSGQRAAVPDFFITGKPSRASAAERGTATHLFLQFCDFSRLAEYGVREEMARLVEKRFIPDHIADLIYVEELERFAHSDLFRRILSAKQVIREQRFNLLLSADAFTKDPSLAEALKGETLAVQGVIDLILIGKNGEIELYDYKTDRLTLAEQSDPSAATKKMNQIHGLQLSYYAHAVEEIFGQKTDIVAIYSTHGGILCPVTPMPLALPDESLDRL